MDTLQRASTIGFIGLGSIGTPMALRLASQGCRVVAHDLSGQAARRAELAAGGALAIVDDAAAVAQQAGLVFLSLPSLEAIRAVVAGLFSGSRKPTVVDLSTTGAAFAQQMHEAAQAAGGWYLDAPVSGGLARASAGTLTLMCSGREDVFARARPWLQLLGEQVFFVGERAGLAQTMKLVNNTLLASAMTVTFEAMVFGVKAGLDPEQMIEILNTGTGRNYATLHKVPESILTGRFDSGGSSHLTEKDLRLYLDEAHALGVPMWATSGLLPFWSFMLAQGLGPRDNTTAIQPLEEWAGVRVRGQQARR